MQKKCGFTEANNNSGGGIAPQEIIAFYRIQIPLIFGYHFVSERIPPFSSFGYLYRDHTQKKYCSWKAAVKVRTSWWWKVLVINST